MNFSATYCYTRKITSMSTEQLVGSSTRMIITIRTTHARTHSLGCTHVFNIKSGKNACRCLSFVLHHLPSFMLARFYLRFICILGIRSLVLVRSASKLRLPTAFHHFSLVETSSRILQARSQIFSDWLKTESMVVPGTGTRVTTTAQCFAASAYSIFHSTSVSERARHVFYWKDRISLEIHPWHAGNIVHNSLLYFPSQFVEFILTPQYFPL